MKLIRPKYVVALSAAVALTVSAGASLAASGAASKTGGPQNAAQRCKEQRKAMGKKAFRELYGVGSKHRAAFSRCVAKLKQEDTQDAKNAAQECRAERQQMGDEAFANKYGTNANKRNAFGKCVSQKAREEAEEDQEATITAAKECKAERAKDRTAFAEKYGTNKNKRNAFGKCVSQKASAHDDDE